MLGDCLSGMLYGCDLEPSTRRHGEARCVPYRCVPNLLYSVPQNHYQPGRLCLTNHDCYCFAWAHSLRSAVRWIPVNKSGWRAESAMGGLCLKMYQPSLHPQ